MQYARCKCGEMESWTSGMVPSQCARCDKCGSGYGYSPTTHVEPVPHLMVPHKVETDDGPATLSRCRYCNHTRAQIKKAGE